MKIKSELTENGSHTAIVYEDADSFEVLDKSMVRQCYAVCFFDNKMVVVYSSKNNHWTLVGGSIEEGESYEGCLRREIKEESNMKVLKFKPIGFQFIKMEGKEFYQLRYVCIVEPYGDFKFDPDGSITEIKMVNPGDYRQYFDWGEIGDRIVERALELKKEL
jgi:8-oxo-dGTP pyrophosphatase MutT (NUDIX family)